LSVLALKFGQVVRPDELADAVWGAQPHATWPKQAQVCVVQLRRALGLAAIETKSVEYRLRLDDEVDVRRFEAHQLR
jgi:DNA-binding SARP family transcriptional activator